MTTASGTLAVLGLFLMAGCASDGPPSPDGSPSGVGVPPEGLADPCNPGASPPTSVEPAHEGEAAVATAAFAALNLSGTPTYDEDVGLRMYRLGNVTASFHDAYRWHPRLWVSGYGGIVLDGGLEGFLGRFGLAEASMPHIGEWQQEDHRGPELSMQVVGSTFWQEVAGRPIESSRGTLRDGGDLVLGKTYLVPSVVPAADGPSLARAVAFMRCNLDLQGLTEEAGHRITSASVGQVDVVDGRLVQHVEVAFTDAPPCATLGVALWQDLGSGDIAAEDPARDSRCFGLGGPETGGTGGP